MIFLNVFLFSAFNIFQRVSILFFLSFLVTISVYHFFFFFFFDFSSILFYLLLLLIIRTFFPLPPLPIFSLRILFFQFIVVFLFSFSLNIILIVYLFLLGLFPFDELPTDVCWTGSFFAQGTVCKVTVLFGHQRRRLKNNEKCFFVPSKQEIDVNCQNPTQLKSSFCGVQIS